MLDSGVSSGLHEWYEDQEAPDHLALSSFSIVSLLALVLELELAPLPMIQNNSLG